MSIKDYLAYAHTGLKRAQITAEEVLSHEDPRTVRITQMAEGLAAFFKSFDSSPPPPEDQT